MTNPHPAQVFTAQYNSTVCAACHQRITEGSRMMADKHTPGKWRHVTCPTGDPAVARRGAAAVRAAIRDATR